MIKSEVTNLWYEECDMVYFRNYIQATKYLEWGATLYDLFVGGDGKLVFCFSKKDHIRFRDKWGTRENNKVDTNG